MDLDPLSEEKCLVCGDRATGTHYGVVSCNGCKGFFRRTILRNQKFTCRFQKACVIDKNFRCACRFCRFQKCVNVGMRREAIQYERDSIGAGGPSSPKKRRDTSPPLGSMSAHLHGEGAHFAQNHAPVLSTAGRGDVINSLMEMEQKGQEEMYIRYRSSVITSSVSTASVGEGGSAFSQPSRPCTVDELNDISRTTLLLMVEWAKNLQPFPSLSMEDKIILLKNYAPQHLILMPAFRSPDTTRVCLFNNTYMSREQGAELDGFAAFKTSNITPRVLDEIVWPMRQLQMREEEFVCLKALAFLHPEAKGLSADTQTVIRDARNKVLKALYQFITAQMPEEAPTRYGNILLLAPALKALTQLLIENMTLTKFFGLAEVDNLLSAFILDDSMSDRIEGSTTSIQQHLTQSAIAPAVTAAQLSSTATASKNASAVTGAPQTTSAETAETAAQRVMTIL